MISIELARHLRDRGLRWMPARGDRFVVGGRDMDEDVFVLSDMTVELHHLPDGDLIGFNGTTEWALDAVEPDDALWLPGESQLRELLGGSFVRLERREDRWHVHLRVSDEEHEVSAPDTAEAYGLALAYLITGDDFSPGA
jgi:hypothetical protein